ncbi:MAG TPA: hypothetical protein VK842_11075 [bacterium]|nr:hypothetical protein [bacterium]
MARLFWASAACFAAVLAPLSLPAKTSGTPEPTAAAAPAAKAADTAAPTAVATVSPSPVATAKATPGGSQAASASSTAKTGGSPLSSTAKTGGTAVSGTAKASDANHKSEALAEILAWVPGIAIHGAGHMYAGSWMHGLGLFALEGACVYEGSQVVNRGNFSKFDVSGGKIPTDLSGAETDIGISLVCGMGFLWTWFDDVAGSTVAVDDYNKLQDQAAGPQAQLNLLPTRGGAMLALSTQF